MTKLRHTATFIATSLLIGAMSTGCNSEEDPEPNNEGNTTSKASALTGDVEQAAANPSGSVGSGTLPGVMDAYDDFELATVGGELPGGLDIDLESALAGCAGGDASAGEVDLSCATSGESSGTIRYEIGIEGSTTYVYYELLGLCSDDVCIDGEGAVKVSADGGGSQQTVAGNLTIDQGGAIDELRYGISVSASAAGLNTHVVLWHNGDSYVVTTSVGADGASYTVEGANGSWSCDLSGSAEALSGSCSNGADEIDF
jgi:hypothetical protein